MDSARLSSRAVIGMYYEALKAQVNAGWIDAISNYFTSDQPVEEYVWLGMPPALREWIGGRQAKGLSDAGIKIENKHFEATLEILLRDLRRDKTGQIRIRMNELAQRGQTHFASLLSTLIVNGASATCYDGQYYFDTDHSEGSSGSQSNSITTDISALPASVHELQSQAKASKGKLAYTPLTEADIQGIGKEGFRALLRDLSGESETFDGQLASLTAKFEDMRRRAASYGVSLEEVAQSEAKARKNLIDSYTSGLRTTIEATTQALIDSVRGPQATLARLNTEIDTGMAGLNALSGTAAQESMGKIMSLVEQRYQLEISNLQALISSAQSLKQTISGLALSDASPLSPMEKLAKSQNDFWRNLAGAQKGDATAMGNLSGSLSAYIGIAKDYYTPNSPEFKALYERATGAAGMVADNALSDVEKKAKDIEAANKAVLDSINDYLKSQAKRDTDIALGLRGVADAISTSLGENSPVVKAVKANNKAVKK